ncbi:hypothetical protein [Halocatena halophila]|uniref:hypothetical protein n=1 Tax=Halocatena halophila TaxID=2814576 RepID=UPI002ED438F0
MGIPALSDQKHRSLSIYICDLYENEVISFNPLKIARVLGNDKRGACINTVHHGWDQDPNAYLPSLFDDLGLSYSTIDTGDWKVAKCELALDFNPFDEFPVSLDESPTAIAEALEHERRTNRQMYSKLAYDWHLPELEDYASMVHNIYNTKSP